jgi:hypothetical protein
MVNSWRRRIPLLVAILLLSLPAALGIQAHLEPTRGKLGSWSAALGLEMLYLSTGILILDSELRRYARSVALSAVASSVLFNTLLDYAKRVPGGLTDTRTFLATFDILSAFLSFVESLPLAGLAYAATILAHRLAEELTVETKVVKRVSWWERLKASLTKTPAPQGPSYAQVLAEAVKGAIAARQQSATAALDTLMDPQQFKVLKAEIQKRKAANETKTATISALWGVSGGGQYAIVSRIYDELVV